jgi:hypothetical protein
MFQTVLRCDDIGCTALKAGEKCFTRYCSDSLAVAMPFLSPIENFKAVLSGEGGYWAHLGRKAAIDGLSPAP